MKRWLYHYEDVRGVPGHLDDILRHRVRQLLATVLDGDGEPAELTPEGDVLVRLPAHVLGRDVHKTVRLHTGVAERRQERTCIPLRWHAEPARLLFPSFDGTIELEPLAAARARVTIVGSAALPLGPVGGAADAVALGGVAERTVAHLTARLAAALEHAVAGPGATVAGSATGDGLRVRDVMTRNPLVLHEDMPLKTAALLLFHYDVAGAPVCGDAGGLIGVLSEADLLDAEAPLRHGVGREVAQSWRRYDARTVGQACSRPAREVHEGAAVRSAAELMRDHDVARLVVVDGSDIAGMISRHDVLKVLVRTDAEVQASLDRLLAAGDEDRVIAAVEWGIAHLAGVVSTRSAAAELATRVTAVDGVVGVEADLTWDVDDVLPPLPML